MQRQIDSLLNEAEAEIRDDDWNLVHQRSKAVWALRGASRAYILEPRAD